MRTPGPRRRARARLPRSLRGFARAGASPTADLAANTVDVAAGGFDPPTRAELLHLLFVRRVRQGRARGGRRRGASRSRAISRCRSRWSGAAGQSALGAGGVCATGGLHATGLFSARGSLVCAARTSAAQRDGQGGRVGFHEGLSRSPTTSSASAGVFPSSSCKRPPSPAARNGRRRGAVDARGRARAGPRSHAVRVRARRSRKRVLGAVADQA